jgi:HEAT repeat protein
MNLKTCLRLAIAVSLLSSIFYGAALAADTNEEARLIGVLQSQASPKEKDAACVWLKRHGTAVSVPALAALLDDEQLSQSARYALESMPGPEAGNALIAALAQTHNLLKAGVINSLGLRREAGAVPELAKLLTDPDVQVARASAASLGDIASPEALKALQNQLNASNSSSQDAVVDGCLRCAQHLLAGGHRKQALAVYQELYRRPDKEFFHVAAWRGMVLADGPDGLTLLANAITQGPASIQMETIELVHEIKIPGVTIAMAKLLPGVDALTQAALIDALRQRDDPAAVPEIALLAQQTNSEVRMAALNALGTLGDDKYIPLLVEVAAATGDPAQATARQALMLVHRGTPDEALLGLLSGAKPEAEVEIIRTLSSRSAVTAVPQLLELARQADDPVREAAFQALGRLADQPQLDDLVKIVGQMTTDDSRASAAQAVDAACHHIQRRHGTVDLTPVLAALKNGSTETRVALLPVCGSLTGEQTRAVLRAGLDDTDAKVRAAALRAMCVTTDAALLPDIEKIACESSDDDSRTLAIEACVRLATQEDSITIPDPDRIKLFQAITPKAANADEKRAVLSGLAVVPDDATLQLAEPLVSDVTVSNEAARAVIQICSKLPDAEAAQAALGRLVSGATSDQIRQDAAAALKVIEGRGDYITTWQVAGPYRQAGKNFTSLFDIVFPPETAGAQGVNWRALPVSNDPNSSGVMDLLKAFGGEQEVAYARTWIRSASEQPARLIINSDDGVKVWLNGKVVLANNIARALTSPPDNVEITLKPGSNDLLLKVTQNIAGWGFCVQLTDPDGSRPKGLQYVLAPQ